MRNETQETRLLLCPALQIATIWKRPENLVARPSLSVAERTTNLTTQFIDNHPGFHYVYNTTVIVIVVKTGEWVQMKN